MSGKTAVTAALKPSGNVVKADPQKSYPFVLKKIMDIPPPNILEEGDDGKIRTRKRALLLVSALLINGEFVDCFDAYIYTQLHVLNPQICAKRR